MEEMTTAGSSEEARTTKGRKKHEESEKKTTYYIVNLTSWRDISSPWQVVAFLKEPTKTMSMGAFVSRQGFSSSGGFNTRIILHT